MEEEVPMDEVPIMTHDWHRPGDNCIATMPLTLASPHPQMECIVRAQICSRLLLLLPENAHQGYIVLTLFNTV